MAEFPQSERGRRATRVRMQAQTIRIATSPPVSGVLQTLSRTGGRAVLTAAVPEGDLVEVEIQTACFAIAGLVEMLAPRSGAAGHVQAFRFVGLSDEDGSRLQEVLRLVKDLGKGGKGR
ncbi:MAG TPA: hypothetical protein VEG08_00195 [Terriglobales bacterium]|nr:hypothetical protein [Terriglobales bacterium]